MRTLPISASLGQYHAPAGALEKQPAEFLLQRTNLHAQRRLHNVEAFCRASKMLFFCDGNEIA
jgi:hypothetical protein